VIVVEKPMDLMSLPDPKRPRDTSVQPHTTTHTLPATHNGSVVTVEIQDSRYEPHTVVNITIKRPDGSDAVKGSLTLGAPTQQVDAELSASSIPTLSSRWMVGLVQYIGARDPEVKKCKMTDNPTPWIVSICFGITVLVFLVCCDHIRRKRIRLREREGDFVRYPDAELAEPDPLPTRSTLNPQGDGLGQ